MQEPILSYANGKGQKIMYSETKDSGTGKCKRNELKQEDFLSMESRAPAMIFDYDEHHGGDDVVIWATGPMSYLFHKAHEQAYVAHVIGYGMCIGPYSTEPECRRHRRERSSRSSNTKSSVFFVLFFVT